MEPLKEGKPEVTSSGKPLRPLPPQPQKVVPPPIETPKAATTEEKPQGEAKQTAAPSKVVTPVDSAVEKLHAAVASGGDLTELQKSMRDMVDGFVSTSYELNGKLCERLATWQKLDSFGMVKLKELALELSVEIKENDTEDSLRERLKGDKFFASCGKSISELSNSITFWARGLILNEADDIMRHEIYVNLIEAAYHALERRDFTTAMALQIAFSKLPIDRLYVTIRAKASYKDYLDLDIITLLG